MLLNHAVRSLKNREKNIGGIFLCLFASSWTSRNYAIAIRPQGKQGTLDNPAAAHHLVAVIEHGRLPGRDRPLRLIKHRCHLARPGGLKRRPGWLVAMAD